MQSSINRFIEDSIVYRAVLKSYLSVTRPIRLLGRLRQKKPINWKSQTFSEKLQWRCKHPDPSVDYALWVDKHRAKEAMQDEFDVPSTYQYITLPDETDMDKLPETYVMKAAHGWNMNLFVQNGIIVNQSQGNAHKGELADPATLQRIARQWLNSTKFERLKIQENHYLFPRPGILFEKLIAADYRLEFFLFHGTTRIIMAHISDIQPSFGNTSSFRLYDPDWNVLEPDSYTGPQTYDQTDLVIPAPEPEFFRKLERRFKSFDHVRVDFMLSEDKLYFNEVTFTHNAGKPSLLGQYEDDLGQYWL